jgi:hypothetical protein
MSLFFFYKIREQKAITGTDWEGLISVGGEADGERVWRVNIEQILCTHVCKWKNETC